MQLSVPVSLWGEFKEEALQDRIPLGSLLIASILPFYGSRESGIWYLTISLTMAGCSAWLGFIIFAALGIIHYWIVSFVFLWLLYFLPSLALVAKIIDDSNVKMFDLGYFFTVGVNFGVWLIMLPLYIDGFVTFHLAWVFLPLFIAQFLLVLTPFVSMWMDCCNISWSDMGGSSDTCCVFMLILWPPVIVFTVMEALIILIVENDVGYWTCVWIPFYILICFAIVAWPILYHESLGSVKRRSYFFEYIKALRE